MNLFALWIAFKGVFVKEVLRFMRGWIQTFLPSFVTTLLYFLVFGSIMGDRIGPMMGYAYPVFITPGLVMLGVITNAYSNVVSSFYGARFNHSIEEMLVSPMPNSIIIAGYVAGGIVRGFLVGIIVLGVGLFFAGFHLVYPLLALLLMVLCSALFSLAGFMNGIFARKFDDLVIVPTFILTPLIYLGGVFFDLSALPSSLRLLGYINPVHYLIDAFRYALLGAQAKESIFSALAGIVFFILLLFFINWHLMKKGVGLRQ